MSSTPEASGSCRIVPGPHRRGRLFAKLVVVSSALVLASVLVVYHFASVKRVALFRGKPESEWIKNLKYWDDQQVAEWRGYGEEGVQVLIRGLKSANHPGERAYRRLNPKLPWLLRRWLPAPKADSTRATRMSVVSLLASLGSQAQSATPVMIWTVKSDESDSVRQCALNYFNSTEDENCILNKLPPKQKLALLPALLSAVQNPRDWGLRNNAAVALKWYPEKRDVVAPVLVTALKDSQPQVRLLAAEALARVAPDVAAKAGTTSILVAIAKLPDDQIAYRAVAALGHSGCEPALAVPALLESLRSSNNLVACQAVWSLEWAPKEFQAYSTNIIPALTTAAERKDNVGGYARKALNRWAPKPGSAEAAK